MFRIDWKSMMESTYWHRQAASQPLFEELLWSRPENKQFAGKLAVIGGNLHGFTAPAESYAEAEKAGIGVVRVLLPDAVHSIVKALMPEVEYAPSTPSGSFNQRALSDWLDLAAWADGTLLAGDLGRNSETAITFENFLTKHHGLLIITKDAVDYALATPSILLKRPETTLVLSMAQLQKLGIAAKLTTPITLSMDLVRLVDALRDLTKQHPINIITKYNETMCVASNGQISTTKLIDDKTIWRVHTAAHAATWLLQNPSKPFESLTTSLVI